MGGVIIFKELYIYSIMRSKKIVLILIIIGALLILVFGGYLIFRSQNSVNPNNSLPNGGLGINDNINSPTPTAIFGPLATINPNQQQDLQAITLGPILGFWPVSTTTIQYFTKDGFFEANFANQPAKIEQKDLGVSFSNVLSVEPAKSNKVLIKYVASGSSQTSYSVLDIVTHALKNLDPNVKTATWSPDGNTLLFYYSDSPLYYQEGFVEHQYLGQMDKNLANKKTLINFRAASDILLSWPTSTTIYISQKPSGVVKQTVLAFNPKTKVFKPFAEENGLILKWNNSGSYGLLFLTGDNGSSPVLKLINKDAVIIGTFPKLTLPEKCVFSQKSPILYCAIPETLDGQAVWPDDYYMGAFNQEEAIYSINLQSLEAQPIIQEAAFEVQGISLSPDESHLIFYDKYSNKLYALVLH